MKDDWRGSPLCFKNSTPCNHQDMRMGEALPCFKCTGSGVKTIAGELKEHPFNHNAMRDRLVREIAYAKVKETITWDETAGKHFYTVNGERVWDWKEAAEKWIALQIVADMVGRKGGLRWLDQ